MYTSCCETEKQKRQFDVNSLHFLHVIIIIAPVSHYSYSHNININKKLEEQVKQLSLKIRKLEKENEYQQKGIKLLYQKIVINFEHWKMKPGDICGPCLCRDRESVSKKYYCKCQNLQHKRDCLEPKQVGKKVERL